jgi:3-phosphoshikimate 1-carboxyvinyltransferase
VRIEPVAALRGAVAVAGAKSIAHRALMLGAIAEGETEIRGFVRSGDTGATVDTLRALGVSIAEVGETVTVQGAGLRGLEEPDEPLDCRNAGTLLRLIAGILAGQHGRFVLTGDDSLRSRPMERIAVPLRAMGAEVETEDGRPPVTVVGGELRPIRYELPVASAQVKSAILLAGLFADGGPTTVVEAAPTRDHTERLLAAAGVRVETRPHSATVWPATRLRPLSLEIPGDFSSAAPFIAAATLLSASELRLVGVNVNPTRTGFLSALERMGARISLFNRRTIGGEPAADLEVKHADLVATTIGPEEVPLLIDELPLFALVAAAARGESVVRGAAELRAKETDRIETVVDALRPLGVRIRGTKDGFRVAGVPARIRGGGRIDSRGDHRIAMLGAIAGLVSREGVELLNPEAAAISFPGFYELLEQVSERSGSER